MNKFEFNELVAPTESSTSLKCFWLVAACLLYCSTNLSQISTCVQQRQATIRARVSVAALPVEPALDPVTKQVVMDLEFISKWATFGQMRSF